MQYPVLPFTISSSNTDFNIYNILFLNRVYFLQYPVVKPVLPVGNQKFTAGKIMLNSFMIFKIIMFSSVLSSFKVLSRLTQGDSEGKIYIYKLCALKNQIPYVNPNPPYRVYRLRHQHRNTRYLQRSLVSRVITVLFQFWEDYESGARNLK